jgi:hypothetical protein
VLLSIMILPGCLLLCVPRGLLLLTALLKLLQDIAVLHLQFKSCYFVI